MCVHVVGRGGSSKEKHLASVVYILKAIACFSYSLPVLAAGIHRFLWKVGRDELYPSFQPTKLKYSLLICYRL